MVEYPGDRDRESPSLLEQRLRAENARLQERVDEMAQKIMDEHNRARRERDGYKALAKVRGEALKRMMGGSSHGGEQIRCSCPLCREAREAMAMTPEEALAKED